jgi:signal transduction histidine kinase
MIEDQSEKDFVRKVEQVRHDMNNALTVLLGNAQILLLRGNLDEKSRERVEQIDEQAQRIRELAKELKED